MPPKPNAFALGCCAACAALVLFALSSDQPRTLAQPAPAAARPDAAKGAAPAQAHAAPLAPLPPNPRPAGPAQGHAAPGAAPPNLDVRIKGAIEKATALLKESLPRQIAGMDALVTVALLKSGVSRNTPEIKAALPKMAARAAGGTYKAAIHHVYEAGVTLMALASADRKKYKPEIEAMARFIIGNQGINGDWDYPNRSTGDTSISQYAMLGLWEAARSGVKVPPEVWDKAAAWHISRQVADGGFAYHPVEGEQTGSLHSMTAAGVGSLLIARRYLYPDRKDNFVQESAKAEPGAAPAPRRERFKYGILERVELREDDEPDDPLEPRATGYAPKVRLAALDASIERGTTWLADHFTVSQPTGWAIYYLYGLERLTALAGLEKVGTHDWYFEGSTYLVESQQADGSWADPSGAAGGASFGLLFLTKATAKMLGKAREVNFGAGLLAGGRGLPENLNEVLVAKGKVEVKKMAGDFEDLLKELENPRSQLVESAQAALVEQVALDRPAELVGQLDRLRKLAIDPRAEVRRTAMWALGRGGDIRGAPLLIQGLNDEEADVVVEARHGLRLLSRRIHEFGAPEPADRNAEIAHWKKWYASVRPYDERDDSASTRKGP